MVPVVVRVRLVRLRSVRFSPLITLEGPVGPMDLIILLALMDVLPTTGPQCRFSRVRMAPSVLVVRACRAATVKLTLVVPGKGIVMGPCLVFLTLLFINLGVVRSRLMGILFRSRPRKESPVAPLSSC